MDTTELATLRAQVRQTDIRLIELHHELCACRQCRAEELQAVRLRERRMAALLETARRA